MYMAKLSINPNYIIVCEGSSEFAYLNELNRFLRELGQTKMFIPKIVGTGDYYPVVKVFNSQRKENKNTLIAIWIDFDRYCRNDNHNREAYVNRNIPKIPAFLFNHHSFEDFFVMHYDDDIVNRWQDICQAQNHFTVPLKSDMAESLLRQHLFSEYAKSSLLPDFIVSKEGLNNLFRHQQSQACRFKSDFAAFLMKELQNII